MAIIHEHDESLAIAIDAKDQTTLGRPPHPVTRRVQILGVAKEVRPCRRLAAQISAIWKK